MPNPVPRVRVASKSDHPAIVKVCKQSPYTRDFTNQIFSGDDCYESGRVVVATICETVVGFLCFRKRVRDEVTVLYFVGVESSNRGAGIGTVLMSDFHRRAGGPTELKVMKDNPAVRLYERLGYVRDGEAYEGKAWVMKRRDPSC